MREAGIKGKVNRRYKATTDSNHRRPVTPNLLKCQGPGNETHSWLGKAVPLQLA